MSPIVAINPNCVSLLHDAETPTRLPHVMAKRNQA